MRNKTIFVLLVTLALFVTPALAGNFVLKNTTGTELLKVLPTGTAYISQLISCGRVYTDADGKLTCGIDTGGNTTEEIQDAAWVAVGGSGTETHITVTYQDSTNDVDFIVSDDWWDGIGDVPTTPPTNGNTTHLSTSDQIYDFVTGQGYLTSYSETDPAWTANSSLVLYSANLNTFTELNSQIADAVLLKSGGILTTAKWCVYDGSGIDCDVEPVVAGLTNIVEDTTPQLGGNLDVQGYNITREGKTTTVGVDATGNLIIII